MSSSIKQQIRDRSEYIGFIEKCFANAHQCYVVHYSCESFYDAVGGKSTRGNDSNLLIVFYVQIMPDDFVMQLHRF